MGRWLSRLADEKNMETPGGVTDKTDKTSSKPVPSVLSVCQRGVCKNFFAAGQQPSDVEVAAAEREERAAILEHDEGMPRDEAERLAADEVGRSETGFDANPVSSPADSLGPKPDAAGACAPKAAPKPPVASPALRPPGWRPEPGPGITILRPAVEVSAVEYDRHFDAMIEALPAGSAEHGRMAFAKRKGWVVDRGSERIFTRGRT